MLQGIADIYPKTTQVDSGTAASQRITPLGLLSLAFESEAAEKESQEFDSAGKLVTASEVQGQISNSLTLSFNEVTWARLGFALNSFPKTASNVFIPTLERAPVPTSAPYEILDADITAAEDGARPFLVMVTSPGGWGQDGYLPRAATPATPAAGEVGVDTTNNKLVFNAAQAGAPIAYTKFTGYTSIEAFGGSGTATNYGIFEVRGKILLPKLSEGLHVYFPQVQISGRPSFTIDNNVPTIEVACSLGTPSGWDEPFAFYNLDTGVAA